MIAFGTRTSPDQQDTTFFKQKPILPVDSHENTIKSNNLLGGRIFPYISYCSGLPQDKTSREIVKCHLILWKTLVLILMILDTDYIDLLVQKMVSLVLVFLELVSAIISYTQLYRVSPILFLFVQNPCQTFFKPSQTFRKCCQGLHSESAELILCI